MADNRFRFGIFSFDAATLELRKGQRSVHLRPQPLKLLRLLIARPRQLVSREEIHKELWGEDVFVDFEQGVNHSVKLLRAALGDDAEAPRFIETLPRRGYRFIAPVELSSEAVESPPISSASVSIEGSRLFTGAQRWVFLAAGIIAIAGLAAVAVKRPWDRPAVLPPNTTLAVLPLGMPEGMHYLGISLADALIARVSAGGEVHVRPTEKILPYDGSIADIKEVGRILQVDYVLTGKVQRIEDTNRVSLQLVDARTAKQVWSDTADVPATDLIGLENSITDRVVSAFATRRPTPGVRGGTENPAAYEAYMQGRYSLARLTSKDTRAAAALFDRALEIDSKYALAHAGAALASAQMAIRFAPEPDVGTWQTRAEQQARRALELEGTLAEAHEALAVVARHIQFDWDRTIEQSQQALRLNPGLDLPHYYLGGVLQHIGRLDLVEAEVVAGLENNPLNLPEAFRLRGMAALWSGRFAEARTYFEQLRDLTSKPVSDTPLAEALYYTGETPKAEAMLAELEGSAAAVTACGGDARKHPRRARPQEWSTRARGPGVVAQIYGSPRRVQPGRDLRRPRSAR